MELEFNGQCPKWLFPILKLLGLARGNPWPKIRSSYISDLIEVGSYHAADKLIDRMEEDFGSSTETTRLRARLARFQILGKGDN